MNLPLASESDRRRRAVVICPPAVVSSLVPPTLTVAVLRSNSGTEKTLGSLMTEKFPDSCPTPVTAISRLPASCRRLSEKLATRLPLALTPSMPVTEPSPDSVPLTPLAAINRWPVTFSMRALAPLACSATLAWLASRAQAGKT